MSQTDTALDRAQRIRDDWIDLTHALPKDAPKEVLRAWNTADTAMRAIIGWLESQ